MSRKRHELISVLLLAAMAVTGAYMFRFLFEPEPEPPAARKETATAPAPEQPKPAGVNRNNLIEPLVRSWMEAISTKNADQYIGLFTGEYSGATEGSRGEWEDQVRKSVGRDGPVSASIRSMNIVPTQDPDLANVVIEQAYTTTGGAYLLKRELTLRWQGKDWKIAGENTTVLEAPGGNGGAAAAQGTADSKDQDATEDAGIPAGSQGIVASLDRFGEAWSRQDLFGFQAAFSKDYPAINAMTAGQWEARTSELVAGPTWIKVFLSDYAVEQQSDDQALVSATLLYVSDSDQAQKTVRMIVRRLADRWVIVDDDYFNDEFNQDPPPPGEAAPVESEPETAGTSTASGAGPDTADANADREEVIAAVNSWAASWEAQDADEYIDSYSERLALPAGETFQTWQQNKRVRLPAPEWIKIELTNVEFRSLDESRTEVEFTQSYRSNNYEDRTRKKLVLERQDQEWLIVEETVLKTL